MNDFPIVAYAKVLCLTLMTDNTHEFGSIRGINVDSWRLAGQIAGQAAIPA